MNSELVTFFYGNPLLYQKEIMESQTLNVLLNKIKDDSPEVWNSWLNINLPHPLSDTVKEDLFNIIKAIEKQNLSDIEFIDIADKNKEFLFYNLLKEKDIEIEIQFLKNITYYLDVITFKLKYHFNYPRPYQAAYALSIPMYPSKSTDANAPAFPSGHSIDAMVLGFILSTIYPVHKKEIMDLAYRISESRYIAGIHFSFDKKIGEEIGLFIAKNYTDFLIELARG
jgi:hypothetical protein